MKILIEGEQYPIKILEDIFDDSKFYRREGSTATILSVGYYHSYEKGELVYMLPKVFMSDNEETVFGINKDDLLRLDASDTFKHAAEYRWVRQISVYFYYSLLEFRKRNSKSTIASTSLSAGLNTNIDDKEYSYLDLLLSFASFYKNNKAYVFYKHIQSKSQQVRKTNWVRTIRKSAPLLCAKNQPVYTIYRNKRNIVDAEEELLTYFFSILHHFSSEHKLHLHIDKSHSVVKGKKFLLLQRNGMAKLKKIKYRYFDDTMRRIYQLCEIYFSRTDESTVKKRREEYISVTNYNLVFEDMVDKLFSDSIGEAKTGDGTTLVNLKYNEDGKIIDHLFDYQSLLDTSDVFYIGDSKYYKSGNQAGKLSQYKQFTYAKNVIQYNIDLFTEKPESKYYKPNIRYRDPETEGYNITPNFFLYGYIRDFRGFDDPELNARGGVLKSFHFVDRLFDRDTLFVKQYEINFLFVLKAYSTLPLHSMEKFRNEIKTKFRNDFIKFFSDGAASGYQLYKYEGSDIKGFVEKHFRLINGKCFRTKEQTLILAKYSEDTSLEELLSDFTEYKLK